MDVGTRSLRYFIAVAEELSFTRAAQRLLVTQPAISRQIRHLEDELEAALFTRDNREVKLTAAGSALLESARQLISDWEVAKQTARAAAARQARVLRVGHQTGIVSQLSATAANALTEQYPGVTVQRRRYDWAGEIAALHEGLVDIAFIWLPADLTGLHAEVVLEEPRMVGMASDHQLASRSAITVADLRDEPLPWPRRAPRIQLNWWAIVPRPDGSEPVWGPATDNISELIEHVAVGPGVCIMPASMAEYHARTDLAWRPLIDADPLRIALAWRADNPNPLHDQYLKLVRNEVDG